jgi:hypothetical protein
MKKSLTNLGGIALCLGATVGALGFTADALLGTVVHVGAYITLHKYTAGSITVNTSNTGEVTTQVTNPTYNLLTMSDFGPAWITVSPEEYIAITNRQQVQLRGTVGRWSGHLYAPSIYQ